MRILRIVYDWPEPWHGLSPGPYFLSQAQGKLGHEVTVFTGGLNGNRIKSGRFKETPEENVTVYNLPRALSQHTGPFLTTSPAALIGYLCKRFIKRNVDLVHGHGQTMLCFNLYRLLFGWLDKTPYFVHFHMCAIDRVKQAKAKGEKFTFLQKYFENPLINLSDKLSLKVASGCIFPSESTRHLFVKYYSSDEAKLHVLDNGVSTQLFTPSESSKTDTKEIFQVSVLSPRKGEHLIINALKYLSADYVYRWIGNIQDENYLNEMKELAKINGVEDRVILQGYVSNLEVAPYFQNSTLFVLPSQSEGLPKVVMEALACGIPVLASGFELSENIDGLNYLDSLDPQNIAKQIKKVVEENQKVDLELIRKNYSWDAKAKELDEIYGRT